MPSTTCGTRSAASRDGRAPTGCQTASAWIRRARRPSPLAGALRGALSPALVVGARLCGWRGSLRLLRCGYSACYQYGDLSTRCGCDASCGERAATRITARVARRLCAVVGRAVSLMGSWSTMHTTGCRQFEGLTLRLRHRARRLADLVGVDRRPWPARHSGSRTIHRWPWRLRARRPARRTACQGPLRMARHHALVGTLAAVVFVRPRRDVADQLEHNLATRSLGERSKHTDCLRHRGANDRSSRRAD